MLYSKKFFFFLFLLSLTGLLRTELQADAQSHPAAQVVQDHSGEMSVSVSGVQARNGIDGWSHAGMIGLKSTWERRYGLDPSLELRGVYPFPSSDVATEKSVQVGVSFARQVWRFRPYGDFFMGRGKIEYSSSYVYNSTVYVNSSGFLYGPGAGLEYPLFGRFSLKADFQYQHWAVPTVRSGSAWSTAGSAGIVYRFRNAARTDLSR